MTPWLVHYRYTGSHVNTIVEEAPCLPTFSEESKSLCTIPRSALRATGQWSIMATTCLVHKDYADALLSSQAFLDAVIFGGWTPLGALDTTLLFDSRPTCSWRCHTS